MLGTSKDITNALVFSDKEQEYLLLELPLKWQQRTLAQNATFQICFTKIANKMWISKGEMKQNCLKALFWVTESKLSGITYENAIISSTTELNKEQATLLIETLIKFWKSLNMGTLVTSREMVALWFN